MSQLIELIKKYEANQSYYRSTAYNESQLRVDFLDPLFKLLGWDITNQQNKSTNEREVLVEEGLKYSKNTNINKPDYTFRLFSERKFFLEAKKPNVDVLGDPEPARQIRRYGFTARLKISVLSNFEYLVIYDTSGVVNEQDKASDYRLCLYHFKEFEEKFDEIKRLLGKDSVYSGLFDDEWSQIEEKIQKFSVDDLFLKQINNWRLSLSEQLLLADSNIDEYKLNDLTQSYINSLFFLRVCEDRNLEIYQTLLSSSKNRDTASLIKILKNADKKYNSGLFDLEFIEKFLGDSNSYVWNIIDELYYPKSPYSFAVFSSDILGNIYEIFLSEKIVIHNGQVILRPKEDNLDRDIVTTPTFVIRDILRKTLMQYCEGKTDKEILSSHFADIACGSGAFLLEAFQYLQDILVDYYLQHGKRYLQQISQNTYKLNFEIKKKLLTSCLFGVDKDFNAVKACQFGLLLKLLEGESNLTISSPVLPVLDKNIFYGNSLIDYKQCPEKDFFSINPFNFNTLSFDVIFGNPPYLSTEDMKQLTPFELPLYKKYYKSAFKQFDKYYLFVEKGLHLLKDNGFLGYILPSKFMKIGAGEKLRGYLASKKCVLEITSFGANQVFKKKTTYTCILILKKASNQHFSFLEVHSLNGWKNRTGEQLDHSILESSMIDSDVWILEKSTKQILQKIYSKTIPLSELLGKKTIENGIQTSANDIYIHEVTKEENGFYYFIYDGVEYKIEKELTRPYYRTTGSFHSYRDFKPNSFVIYPYRRIDNRIIHVPYDELMLKYPNLFYFLNKIRGKFKKTRDIKPEPQTPNEWYRYGRHQSLENCDVDTKIIVGVLSNGYKYAIDKNRTFVSSGGTAGYCIINIPEKIKYSPYYLQALLSSKYLEWFASLYGEVFRGGFIARGTKVLKRMPIVPIDFNNPNESELHDEIISTQKKLIEDFTLLDSASEREKTIIKRRFLENQKKQDSLIQRLYGLGQDDEKIPSITEIYNNKIFEVDN